MRFTLLILLTAGVVGLQGCSKAEDGQDPFLSYLPQAGEVGAWKPEYEPQHVEGEDLFSLINGGAEIYHEYGFKQAVVQSYVDENERSLNLEIYEMSDPHAAYGIYTFKKGDKGRDLDVGDAASQQDYYLNAWKGNFLVTVVGFDSEKETIDGLRILADAVAGRITLQGQKPPLLDLLPKQGLDPSSIKYLKGNLALFNNHEFATGNIFSVREGLAAKVGDDEVFLFVYGSENEAAKQLASAWEALSQGVRYRDVVASDEAHTAVDNEENRLAATTVDRYILLAVGTSPESTLDVLVDSVNSQQ
jgi:hypothetical protein